MKYKNCNACGEEMQEISTSDGPTYSRIFLDNGETASLYACTSRDCRNVGIVMMIPHLAKED